MATRKILKATVIFFFIWHGNTYALEAKNFEEALKLGDEAFYFKEYKDSEAYYKLALEKKPHEVSAIIRLGQFYYATGDYKKSREKFEEAHALYQSPIARLFKKESLSKLYIDAALKQLADGWSTLQAIEEENKKAKPDILRLVSLHYKIVENRPREKSYLALVGPHLEFILEKDPENESLLKYLAAAYYFSSDPVQASVFFEKIVKIYPSDFVWRERLAESLIAASRFDQAKHEYKVAMRLAYAQNLRPKMKEILKLIEALPPSMDQALMHIKNKEYNKALTELKPRLARHPGDVAAIVALGSAYEGLNDNQKAERLYSRASQLDPNYPEIHFYLGRFYLLKKKKFEKAVTELKTYREKMVKVLSRIKDPAGQKEANKNLVQSTRYLAYIYGSILKEPEKSLWELKKAEQLDGENPEVLYDLGVAYLNTKKKMSAYQAFKKVMELAEPESEIYQAAENAVSYIRHFTDNLGGGYTGPYDEGGYPRDVLRRRDALGD